MAKPIRPDQPGTMGRPIQSPHGERLKAVLLMLLPSEARYLARLAVRMHMSRSQLIRTLLRRTINEERQRTEIKDAASETLDRSGHGPMDSATSPTGTLIKT